MQEDYVLMCYHFFDTSTLMDTMEYNPCLHSISRKIYRYFVKKIERCSLVTKGNYKQWHQGRLQENMTNFS